MYKVLIADDNIGWCDVLAENIDMYKEFKVIATANDGKVAIELIGELLPDVIILDIIMPEFDGVHIVEYVRNKIFDYEPVIYILSGIGTDTVIKILNDMRIDFYSLKPISIANFMQNLKSITVKKTCNTEKYKITNAKNYERTVHEVIYNLGFSQNILATAYIYDAILYYLGNPESFRMLTKFLYPNIAQKHNTTAAAVEKNIRQGISKIEKNKTDFFKEVFINEQAHKITSGLFLSVVSEYIVRNYIKQP